MQSLPAKSSCFGWKVPGVAGGATTPWPYLPPNLKQQRRPKGKSSWDFRVDMGTFGSMEILSATGREHIHRNKENLLVRASSLRPSDSLNRTVAALFVQS